MRLVRDGFHKVQRMVSALSFLQQYAIHGHGFLKCIVTGDKMWVHPLLCRDKMCKHGVETSQAPTIKKIQDVQICWQSDSCGVWDCKGVLLVDSMKNGTTISAASYWETLEWLQATIKQQRPGLPTTGVLLLHNNVRPTSQLQHNSCSASDGQSWNICCTTQI